MISVNPRTLRDSINEGIEEAKKKGSPQLVTHVEEIDPIDPHLFFKNGQSKYYGKRFFWESPSHLTLVGIGQAFKLEGTGSKRVQTIKTNWEKTCVRVFGHIKERATGPVIFGGFSFDPEDTRPSVWKGYSEGGFVIPKYLLTINNNKAFLSLNIWVDKTSSEEALLMDQQGDLKVLFNTKEVISSEPTVIETIKDLDKDQWLMSVEQATTEIRKGKLEKVVLSREVSVKSNRSFKVEDILRQLSLQQPNSYIFAIEKEEACFLGATPERLIERIESRLLTGAVAGTAARGRNKDDDRRLGEALLHSAKNREEHQYVVNMIEQAMSNFCKDLDVPASPQLLKVKDVQHLYTPITGSVKSGATLLDIIEKLHPTPALGGQPREAALKFIRDHETYNRGWYASPIGWMDLDGQGEFAVALRSGLIKGTEARLFAGCGVVEASDPLEEFEETHLKLKPMLTALEGGNSDGL